MDAQETLLGTYRLEDGRIKTVVACQDFTEDGSRFVPFLDVKNSCLSSDESGAGTELSNILTALNEQKWMEPERLCGFYWDMFVVDSLIGNFDRHNGNWGFLIDKNMMSEPPRCSTADPACTLSFLSGITEGFSTTAMRSI